MIEVYKTGQFIDAAGNERKFVACAVLREEKSELVLASIASVNVIGIPHPVAVPVRESEGDGHIRAGIFLGVAVCSATDTFDEAYGTKVALGRALNGRRPQKWLHTDFPELLNEDFVSKCCERFKEMIELEPEKYAPGYFRNEASDTFNTLSPTEQEIVKGLKDGTLDMTKLQELAGKLKGIPLQAEPKK